MGFDYSQRNRYDYKCSIEKSVRRTGQKNKTQNTKSAASIQPAHTVIPVPSMPTHSGMLILEVSERRQRRAAMGAQG
jgi:hypothetical protein